MAKHHQQPDYSDDDDFFDEEYFARTYRPLSNLPTPPPSSRNSSATQSPRSLLEDGGLLDSALLGPAVHLVNLVPPAASLATPSVQLVHDILRRANRPLDAIALAVCILDSLSSKFSLNWRLLCPLANQRDTSSKRHTITATSPLPEQLHIDCVNPEVIILASLMIATKFLEDCQEPTQYYRSTWGKNMWTCEQINVTERCIMESLGYRILPLWDPELITDALGDMERAGKQAVMPLLPNGCISIPRTHDHHQHQRSKTLGGQAVLGLGLQLTPVETPLSENGGSSAQDYIGGDLRAAFPTGSPSISCESLQLPHSKVKRNKSFTPGGLLG